MGSEEFTWIDGQAKESMTRAVTFNSFSITWDGKRNRNSESHPWLTRRETGGRSSCLVSIHIVLRAGYCSNVDTVKSLEWERQVGLIHLEVHCLSAISLLLNTDFLTLALRGPFLCSSLWQNSKRVKHTNQVCLCPTILQFSIPKSPVTSPSRSMGLQTSPSQNVIQCFLIAPPILACHPPK